MNNLLSIIIPVYNEILTIEDVVSKVKKIELIENFKKEIIIVDDFSTDGSTDVLKKIEKENDNIKVYFHEKNKGKGAAIRTAISNIKNGYLIIQDADLEYNPEEINKLLQPVIEADAEVVYGSRFVAGKYHRILYFWHTMGNKLITLLSNIFTNLNFTDIEVCYKLIKVDILKDIKLKENRFGFEPEITAKIAKINKKNSIRIYEVGISYRGRTYDEGKKIGWRDGIAALKCIVKYNIFD
jgi:glycosyltransferase involved in cell wall biosynthesis